MGIAVERVLDAVAVVGVDVDVGHAQPALAQAQDRQHGVVDVAEAGRALPHRMMQTAGEVEYAVGLAADDEVGGQQRAGGHEPGGLPHAAEDRVVAGPEAERGRAGRRRAGVRRLQDAQILRLVEHRQVALGGRRRHVHRRARQSHEPVGLHEPPREPQALHAQGVLGPVVEAGPVVRMDQRRLHRDRFQSPDLPPDFSRSSRLVMLTPFSRALTMS